MLITYPGPDEGVYLSTHENEDGTLGVHVKAGEPIDVPADVAEALVAQGWKKGKAAAAAKPRAARKPRAKKSAAAPAPAPTNPAPAAKTED